jgi:hypothetical protein
MPLGQRQLFVYWRVAHVDLSAALQAAREWQAGLMARQPALQCRLYQRSDPMAREATVMESYAITEAQPHPGIDDALCQHIEQAGHAALQPWLRGPRHLEAFDALTG